MSSRATGGTGSCDCRRSEGVEAVGNVLGRAGIVLGTARHEVSVAIEGFTTESPSVHDPTAHHPRHAEALRTQPTTPPRSCPTGPAREPESNQLRRGKAHDTAASAARHNATVTDTGADDLCLLQAFEPVIRFTAGELFLPTAIEPYVARCAMWEVDQDGTARRLVAEGELTIERLVDEAAARQGADLSLRFVTEPLGRRAYRQWRKRPGRPEFHSGGRFGQVGLLSRSLDAVFRLGLLLRGTVPGGLAAAAEQTYRNELDSRHHPYYGRVVRDGGYVVLQYWFFYAMNDWRSGFGGANHHEADWEQVTVYLVEGADGECRPAWVAFSAHDEVGDDLRRRWDDPELVHVGDHPVVFAGAGSHSGAFVAGEYVTVVNPPHSLRGVFRVLRAIASVVTPWSRGEIARGVGVPFVDYARGDGETFGHGQASPWTPVLIDDKTRWVEGYRGFGVWTPETVSVANAPPPVRATSVVVQSASRGSTPWVGAASTRCLRRRPSPAGSFWTASPR